MVADMAFLISPKPTMPWLIALTAIIHFSLQIISTQFYSQEVPWLGALLYILGGTIDIVVSAHLLRKALIEKSKQFLRMGIGLCLLGTTFILLGLGVAGVFGPTVLQNVDLANYMLIIGSFLSALFFAFSATDKRLRSGAVLLVVALVLLILLVTGLYQAHQFLPPLFAGAGVPTLLRQQLITVVLIIFLLSALRYALLSGG